MEQRQTLDISWNTIVKLFIAGFACYIVFLARNIAIWFFFGLIISILMEPAIRSLRWFKVPKVIAVILVYVFVFGLLGLLIYLTSPIFIFEIKELSQNLPQYFEAINPILKDVGIGFAQNFQDFSAGLVAVLGQSSDSIIKAVTVFFGGITSSAVIFTFAFFMSLEDRGPEKLLALLTPKKYEESTLALFERAQTKVSGWFAARVVACLMVGVISFVVFFLFGIKYAFILALVSGFLNFIPYVGPTITLLLAAVFVGVSNSWVMSAYIIVSLLVIQEIENKLLTPILMKRFMDLPPALVLISLLVGNAVFGFLGMIFAVPVFGIAYEFLKEFLQKRKEEDGYVTSTE